MALKRDSVAVDRLERLPDGRTAVTARIWRAEDHGGRIPHKDVWRHIKDTAVGPGFRGVVYDPRYFQLAAEELEDEGVEVVEFDQDPARMAPACGHTFELIVAGLIVHDGDPDLAGHVLAAVKRQQERGFTLAKGKSRRHIDGAVAMCMGAWVLEQVADDDDGEAHAAALGQTRDCPGCGRTRSALRFYDDQWTEHDQCSDCREATT